MRVFPVLLASLLLVVAAGCGTGGGGDMGGCPMLVGHADCAATGTVTVVNGSDVFFARVTLTDSSGNSFSVSNPGYGSSTFPGTPYGFFSVVAYSASGAVLGSGSGDIESGTFTFTFY